MKKQVAVLLSLLILVSLGACGGKGTPDPVFHISGSPDPIMYGCGNTLTFKVVGPSENIRVDSVIVSYNLYNSAEAKVDTGSVSLIPSAGEPPTTYIGAVALSIPSGTGSDPSDIASSPFGEGRVEFGGFVDAWFISTPDSGPRKPAGHTEEKSIAVIPCPATPTAVPLLKLTIVPPLVVDATLVSPSSKDKPKPGDSGEPLPPPSCSVEPNNPSCVP